VLRSPMAEVVQGTLGMALTERKALWTYLRQVSAKPTNAEPTCPGPFTGREVQAREPARA